MRLRRLLVDALDRRGGRSALAVAATWYSRRRTLLDVQYIYDRAWIHRIGSTYVPVSDRFEFRRDWDSALDSITGPIRDNWFHIYKPSPGDTIVDVGAGDGLDSLVFSGAVGPTGSVLAIEAHPATFVLLEQTCALNGLANVTPVEAAAMDEDGSVQMVEAGAHRDFYSVLTNGSTAPAPVVAVRATTIDRLCRESGIEKVDFLKMNIEGAERIALKGATDVLAATAHVCVACHDFLADESPHLATKSFVIDFLETSGFDIVLRDDDPLPWVRDHVHGVRRRTSPVAGAP